MTRMNADDAQDGFPGLVRRVSSEGERIVIQEGDKDVAAIVSMADLALLEELEDRIDALEARQAEAEAATKGEKPIPWDQAKKSLGL